MDFRCLLKPKLLPLFKFSIDDCDHTGDHENYFKYVTEAFEIDGTKYTNCTKRAVSYRSKNEQKPLSKLSKISFLLSDGESFFRLNHKKISDESGKENIDPKYS